MQQKEGDDKRRPKYISFSLVFVLTCQHVSWLRTLKYLEDAIRVTEVNTGGSVGIEHNEIARNWNAGRGVSECSVCLGNREPD